ncbi:unnamed protein product [Enterobius vermicularis]|uniref:Fringe glycosyltransferase n=1 Tax=Enterobius vermicularis TaxID=51028 RepID=A0A0N4VG41_ENTVE|nr:unnamed protein product [Enterobius vermicularis]
MLRTVRSIGAHIVFVTLMITTVLFLSFSQLGFSRYIEKTPITVSVEDVIIAVKTTGKYHRSRVLDIVDTWFQLAPNIIFFVTDTEDEYLNKITGNKVILCDCLLGHTRESLCCKMNAELELFTSVKSRWGCHFDDDNYVHIAELLKLLEKYDPSADWYLGKPSTLGPVNLENANDKVDFWFATGGAGFCLSRSLLTKMVSYIRNGGFEMLGEQLKLPDDITLGYLINHLLNVNLTFIQKFHSHLEPLQDIPGDDLRDQISLSAGSYVKGERNLVNVPVIFSTKDDPRRFRSLHCFLYTDSCNQRSTLPILKVT